MDERLLYLSDPEIESVRFIGGIPTPVISFEVRMRFSPHHGRRPSFRVIGAPKNSHASYAREIGPALCRHRALFAAS